MASNTDADAMHDLTREVSGSDASLQEAIHSGEIASPQLMTFNMWQAWRAAEGRRPTMDRDGMTRSTAQESDLWRLVMRNLHGDDWHTRALAMEMPRRAA